MDELSAHLHKLREDFSKSTLSEHEADADPSLQFRKWMQEAVESRVPEVQAMHLSTVSAEGKPSSRILYLREFGEHRFTFYTNYDSKKSQELKNNPQAAMTFFWPELERQIRIEGRISAADPEQSDAYYHLRPFESKIGAWASPQSKRISSREILNENIRKFKEQFTPDNISRPDHWGGLTLTADYYEFWQGRKSRLHDRLAYALKNNRWNLFRLAP